LIVLEPCLPRDIMGKTFPVIECFRRINAHVDTSLSAATPL
jgi:hypothetical protein